ncbi:Sulfhydrogenase 1 subunit alpha [Candidatus Bilamarchaeum dharawalense]|uniref:Sulfhydrogenase 1 subunit alpha n=1 Tax=Candidatus Bilamarchaeum dharawalense TaxID=2885759 RepID=A0A5E4LR93_9ARCH|nr:Sulfhydrogenase 1 subunit alpha [Candidatus Bilamarchaeum dharawalense]
MHSQNFDITIKDLSKIEGHTDLEVEVRKGKVIRAKLKIDENKRFFNEAVVGKPALGVHQMVSRICGTCSIAHLMCCINSIENALEIKPSEQTMKLRNLLFHGLNIRDHAMHLYLFCLPDVFGKDSILEFADEGYEHDLIHKAFDIKSVGNDLSILIGGRAIHSPFPQVGGFLKIPKNEDAKKIAQKLRGIRQSAMEFVEIFYKSDLKFDTETTYIALRNDSFSYLGGNLMTSDGICIPKKSFREHLQKFVIPYSQAPGFEYAGKPYVVGALARMNISKDTLHKNTKKDLTRYLNVFPSKNIFHNNLAQAIEIIHCIDSAIEILETTEFKDEPKMVIKPRKAEGVGVLEAPRGTLFYNIKIDDAGKVEFVDLVIPTSQNQIKIDKDIGALVQKKLDSGMKKDDIPLEVEKLVRAYDPCMSCATHFLKVKWRES